MCMYPATSVFSCNYITRLSRSICIIESGEPGNEASSHTSFTLASSGSRAAEKIVGAQGKYKSGAHTIDCVWGVWGHMPRKFEILQPLKYASEAPFACIQYINNYQLASSFSGFRSKSMTYRALVSGSAVVA